MPAQQLTNAIVGFVFLAVLILIAVNFCSVSFKCGHGGVHEGIDPDVWFGTTQPPTTPRRAQQLQAAFTSYCKQMRQLIKTYERYRKIRLPRNVNSLTSEIEGEGRVPMGGRHDWKAYLRELEGQMHNLRIRIERLEAQAAAAGVRLTGPCPRVRF